MRQKQAKQRENKEQRISLRFPGGLGGARRTTRRLVANQTAEDIAAMGGPNSARNTSSHAANQESN